MVISCAYSRSTQETDTLSWSVGDGAAAFLVGEAPGGEGLLAMKTINTASERGAMYFELIDGVIRMKAGKSAGPALGLLSGICG